MTLNDLQGYLFTASLLKCDFSSSYVSVDKISPDVVRRAVPMR